MSEIKSIFICRNCDAQHPKWSGRCLECGAWGTLTEEIRDTHSQKQVLAKKVGGTEIINLKTIKEKSLPRLLTNISEIDRVLGGGLVPGSLILLSGEPGVGKSTLVAQIIEAVTKKARAVYVSGEESASQVKARLDRLNCSVEKIGFIAETNVEKIITTISQDQPEVLVVDSIQTVYSSLVPAEAGNISQIRAAAVKFLELAKGNNIAVILIGHITKDGQIAGPKSLEHIVDTVLYLEREINHNYSLLRATKNRFGSINELGVLEMTNTGFQELSNPSTIFIDEQLGSVPGSVATCVIEGSRPFLVNIQALVSKTIFGYPQRKVSGLDLSRLQVLSAVISKRTKINLVSADIILNIVGGLKINDPALDLASCAAIISSQLNKSFPSDTVVLGEVGLGGEVRSVSRLAERLKEAKRLGYKKALVPDNAKTITGLELIKVKELQDLVKFIA